MAKKQVNTAPNNVTVAPVATSNQATRTTKATSTKTPVKSTTTTRHAKAPIAKKIPVEVSLPEITAVGEIPVKAEPIVAAPVVNAHEAISKIAYGYFVARGYQQGNPADDWFRAEREFYSL